MTLDLEAIARRTNSELTCLKSALPLIEQGYAPPFLARYRRDELGGLGEHAMWSLYRAMREDTWIKNRRDDLIQRLEQMPQVDPAIARAVRSASSKRVIDRLARRVRSESGETSSAAKRLAARILSPEKGDPGDVRSLAALMGIADDAVENPAALDAALISRLAIHPQMQSTAVRWLFNNAKIRVLSVSDTHADPSTANDSADAEAKHLDAESSGVAPAPSSPVLAEPATADDKTTDGEPAAGLAGSGQAAEFSAASVETAAADESQPAADATAVGADAESGQPGEVQEGEVQAEAQWPTPEELASATASSGAAGSGDAANDAQGDASGQGTPAELAAVATGRLKAKGKAKAKPAAKGKELKTVKKVSPRQRRRRWLVSVLQPLAGKEILAQKLTAFQTLMIGRGLRSGVVHCQFVYDTEKLSEQLQRTAGGMNEAFAAKLRELVATNDSVIREAAEAAWWDELLESSATRLVNVAADHLESQIDRGGVDAKIILSIDAMGPRTAAVAIVAADGRLLHTEDIACQLTAAMRSSAVTRLGELIHQYGVDLIVVSNGPARRGCLVILHELVEQSPPGSIRWTIAERSGADVYAGSELGNREMRSTPRRFRSAAWLAFSVLRPSQAITKVDPMRLRLGSFQRELSEDALWPALRDVMTSGVSRGGVDVNSAPVDWLCQLPGLNREIATAIDRRRRESLFTSRSELLELEQWTDPARSRQAIAFLRVFGSAETLDGTLIHPDDYALAKKLATALKLELPPPAPPGYRPPNFDEPEPIAAVEPAAPMSKVEDLNGSERVSADSFGADIHPASEAAQSSEAGEVAADEEAGSTQTVQANAAASDEGVADEVDSVAAVGSVAESETLQADTPAAESSASETPASASSPTDPGASAAVAELELHAPVRQPMPDEALINKCIKEWQVGARRVRNVVEALCNPFGDEDAVAVGVPHAVMTKVPKVSDLRVGDQVIGVIVGVTEFGAFVEMSPDCSGLIHVSRVADRFVEDLHEAVQVGDVITAWVTNVDTKRRRVGLSAISPEREMQLERQRQERREESGHRGRHQGSRPQRDEQRGGQNRGDQVRGGQGRGEANRGGRGDNRSTVPRGDAPGSDANRSAPASGGGAVGSQQGDSASRGRETRPDARGGRNDSRGGGRGGSGRGDARHGGQRGGRRDRDDGPTSYSTRVPRSDTPTTPISEAMAKGDEPLRSFGDLMQFFKKAEPAPVVKPQAAEPVADVQPADAQPAAPEMPEPIASPAPRPASAAQEPSPERGADEATERAHVSAAEAERISDGASSEP